ncbi:hypothetical protein [Haematobacter sp. UBA3484]|uniref:hypothetical protein n=1 Tax=Haematobacter sp. UBA3484 TaxID=1946582 RepID=UPI0025BCFCBA|nr:hypothetical protein [Haematobacter sp. UBA3484]
MEPVKASRGRGAAIKSERRRRNGDALAGRRNKLAVDESKLDRTQWSYRWVNDEDNRVQTLSQLDDWEVAPEGAAIHNTGTGSESAVQVGAGKEGQPIRAVLMRKPLQYQKDDDAEKQRLIDEREKGLSRGMVPGGDTRGLTPVTDGISITRG